MVLPELDSVQARLRCPLWASEAEGAAWGEFLMYRGG